SSRGKAGWTHSFFHNRQAVPVLHVEMSACCFILSVISIFDIIFSHSLTQFSILCKYRLPILFLRRATAQSEERLLLWFFWKSQRNGYCCGSFGKISRGTPVIS